MTGGEGTGSPIKQRAVRGCCVLLPGQPGEARTDTGRAALLGPEQGFPKEGTGCPGLLPQLHKGTHVQACRTPVPTLTPPPPQDPGLPGQAYPPWAQKPKSLVSQSALPRTEPVLTPVPSVTSHSNTRASWALTAVFHEAAARLQPWDPRSKPGLPTGHWPIPRARLPPGDSGVRGLLLRSQAGHMLFPARVYLQPQPKMGGGGNVHGTPGPGAWSWKRLATATQPPHRGIPSPYPPHQRGH